jgi:MFS family permease
VCLCVCTRERQTSLPVRSPWLGSVGRRSWIGSVVSGRFESPCSNPGLAVLGIMAWGAGTSLEFPVGISAAADAENLAATRVGVVSTIAYTGFLDGPPALGFLGDHVGTLNSLLAILALLVPGILLAKSVEEPSRQSDIETLFHPPNPADIGE